MIDKTIFENVCDNAKIRLEYGGEDYAAVCEFLAMIDEDLDKIEIDAGIDLPAFDTQLVNTCREDIPQPCLPREELLAAIGYAEAGCVSLPVKMREEG